MGDILFIIAFLGLMLGPFIYFGIKKKKGMWFWVGTVGTMGAVLGLGELTSQLMIHQTLSRSVWNMSLGETLIILGCMALSWLLLLLHLAWKKITAKK